MYEHFIISLFARLYASMIITHSEVVKHKCRNECITAHIEELRDHLRVALGVILGVPMYRISNLGLERKSRGDGVVVVAEIPKRTNLRRATVFNQKIRTLSSKAGLTAERGSDGSIVSTSPKDINIKSIANMNNLVVAYELIKSKPGNMTEGVNPETLDGVSLKLLEKIQKDLRSGTFNFPPARRVQIPKPGKKETRPLTIAAPRDKIVQNAIKLVMEPIFEKFFLDCSHGFRPNRGTRTAMRHIDAKFQSSHYIIEADFAKAFDSIAHDKLMKYLRETITCEKTLRLIKSGLKAGYIEFGNLHEHLDTGTPQGSILSPLLCNIFLHQLDLFMEDIKQQFNVGTKKKKSKEYESITNKMKYMRRKGQDKIYPDKYRELHNKLLSTPSMALDNEYVRVNYTRYADDFIIGVEGGHNIAESILVKVEEFINNQLGLKLNPDKTGITKYSEKPVSFLGYKMMAPHMKGIIKPIEILNLKFKSKEVEQDSRIIARRKKIRIRFNMDNEKVLKRLEMNRFIRKRTMHQDHKRLVYRGTFKGNLINLDHADIVRYYNAVMRGIYNYYNFTTNMDLLANVIWLLKESCALTLGRKFKIKTLAGVFRKFGGDLECNVELKSGEVKKVAVYKPIDFRKKSIVKGTTQVGDPFKVIDKV